MNNLIIIWFGGNQRTKSLNGASTARFDETMDTLNHVSYYTRLTVPLVLCQLRPTRWVANKVKICQ